MSAQICPSCLSTRFENGRCGQCGFIPAGYKAPQTALLMDTVIGNYRIGVMKTSSRQSQIYTGVHIGTSAGVIIEEFFPQRVAGRIPGNPQVMLANNDPELDRKFQQGCMQIEASEQKRPLKRIETVRANNTVYSVFEPVVNSSVAAQCEALADYPIYFRDSAGKPRMSINLLEIPPMPPERQFNPGQIDNKALETQQDSMTKEQFYQNTTEETNGRKFQPKNRKLWLIILLAVLGALILGTGATKLIGQKWPWEYLTAVETPTPEPEPTETVAPPTETPVVVTDTPSPVPTDSETPGDDAEEPVDGTEEITDESAGDDADEGDQNRVEENEAAQNELTASDNAEGEVIITTTETNVQDNSAGPENKDESASDEGENSDVQAANDSNAVTTENPTSPGEETELSDSNDADNTDPAAEDKQADTPADLTKDEKDPGQNPTTTITATPEVSTLPPTDERAVPQIPTESPIPTITPTPTSTQEIEKAEENSFLLKTDLRGNNTGTVNAIVAKDCTAEARILDAQWELKRNIYDFQRVSSLDAVKGIRKGDRDQYNDQDYAGYYTEIRPGTYGFEDGIYIVQIRVLRNGEEIQTDETPFEIQNNRVLTTNVELPSKPGEEKPINIIKSADNASSNVIPSNTEQPSAPAASEAPAAKTTPSSDNAELDKIRSITKRPSAGVNQVKGILRLNTRTDVKAVTVKFTSGNQSTLEYRLTRKQGAIDGTYQWEYNFDQTPAAINGSSISMTITYRLDGNTTKSETIPLGE